MAKSDLLFTGDFKLGPSATCEEAELPQADILVMESTFGKPKYRMPPRAGSHRRTDRPRTARL